MHTYYIFMLCFVIIRMENN